MLPLSSRGGALAALVASSGPPRPLRQQPDYDDEVNRLLQYFLHSHRMTTRILFWAARGDAARVRRFIDGDGDDVNATDFLGYSALHWIGIYSKHASIAEVIGVLARRGADLDAYSVRGETPLHMAALAASGVPGLREFIS